MRRCYIVYISSFSGSMDLSVLSQLGPFVLVCSPHPHHYSPGSMRQKALLRSVYFLFIRNLGFYEPRLGLFHHTTTILVLFSPPGGSVISFIGFHIVFSSNFQRVFGGSSFSWAFWLSSVLLWTLYKVPNISRGDVKQYETSQRVHR